MYNPSEYMKAGYLPLAGIRLEGALDFVAKCCVMCPCRYNEQDSVIEAEIAPGLWIASGYYWENDHLFRRIKDEA